MATLPKPKPQFFKYVDKPANVGEAELGRARPVYISNLPAGGDTSDLEAQIAALEARVEALEAL